jgi:ferritin-like metal-binding protein YciE
MPLDTLDGMLAHELSDLLSAENQFAKALAQTAKAADSEQVRQLAQEHLEETKQQAENLKQAFSILGQKPEKGLVCKGAQGIVEENSSTLKEEKPKGVMKDLALIGGNLRVEHYEDRGLHQGRGAGQSSGAERSREDSAGQSGAGKSNG